MSEVVKWPKTHKIAIKPAEVPRTGGTEVFYCKDCGSPVVDHWEARMAHNQRIHGGKAC